MQIWRQMLNSQSQFLMNSKMFYMHWLFIGNVLIASQKWGKGLPSTSEVHGTHIANVVWTWIRLIAETTNRCTTCCWWDVRIVWQLHIGAQVQWRSKVNPQPSQTESSTNQTSAQGPTTNDIYPKLTRVHYLTLIDANSECHNLNWRGLHT